MADRVKKELEEKRAKLVELRRARDERKALLAQAEKGTSEVIILILVCVEEVAANASQYPHRAKTSMTSSIL